MNAPKAARQQAADLFRACLVQGALDENRVRQAVEELARAKPRGYLATLTVFRRLIKLESARRTAKIESALPLPHEQQIHVLDSLARVYGTGLDASFAENPELIGGMRIQVGSDVYDGSVRGRLAALEQSF